MTKYKLKKKNIKRSYCTIYVNSGLECGSAQSCCEFTLTSQSLLGHEKSGNNMNIMLPHQHHMVYLTHWPVKVHI